MPPTSGSSSYVSGAKINSVISVRQEIEIDVRVISTNRDPFKAIEDISCGDLYYA
jgi:hypothetical protein